jgi:hypothetical protein
MSTGAMHSPRLGALHLRSRDVGQQRPLPCQSEPATTERTYYDLITAVKQGHATDVAALLRKGANPNVLGRSLRQGEGRISALALAIERASPAMVELLLRHGANPHDIDYVYSAPAPVGATATALHFLCKVQMQAAKWCSVAGTLLAHGVPIDARNRAGLTALQLCTERGLDECRRFLVMAGADQHVEFPGGVTSGAPPPAIALHRMAQSGQWKHGLLKLLKGGHDIDAMDPDRNSPLDLAVAHAVRLSELGSARAAPAFQAIHGWIAAGARPCDALLASYPPGTKIGDALRMFRIDAAVACGDDRFVWHVLESDLDREDADCQAAGARLDLHDDSPDIAEALDLWLASGFGKDALPPDLHHARTCASPLDARSNEQEQMSTPPLSPELSAVAGRDLQARVTRLLDAPWTGHWHTVGIGAQRPP